MLRERPPHTPGSLGCLRRLKNGSSSVWPGWQESIRSNLSHQQHTRLPLSRSQRPQLLLIREATFPLPAPSTEHRVPRSRTPTIPGSSSTAPLSGSRNKAQAWQDVGLMFPFSSPHQPAALRGPRPPPPLPTGVSPTGPFLPVLRAAPVRPLWPSGS